MNSLLAILFSAVAGSHGWGMRGTLLGHGKGALLPGLLIGLGAAFATGNPKVIQFAWMIAAFGAVGMFPGGGMSYGETVGLVIRREAPKRGTAGFALKGFLWFAVAAGVISVGIMSLGMTVYTLADVILLFCIFVLARPLGIKLFNRGKNKLYFSKTRKESWGENLLMLAGLTCVMLVHGDWFSLTVTLVAGIFGALGWVGGIWGYALGNDGKLFRRLSSRGMFGGWKLMEFTLGAFGGLGTALGVVIAKALFPGVLSQGWFANDAGLSGYIPQGASLALGLVWCGLCVFVTVFCLLTENKSWGEAAEDFLFDTVYFAVPFLFLCLGSYHTACFAAIPVMLYVLVEKYTVGRKAIGKTIPTVLLYALTALILAADAILTAAIPLSLVALGCMSVYLVINCIEHLRKPGFPDKKGPARYGSAVSVDAWFILSAVLTAILWFLLV